MSVREIVNGRFVGLRVQRTIDGVPTIRTFSYRMPVRSRGITVFRDATEEEKIKMRARAEKLDKKWALEQKSKAVKAVYNPFKVTSRNNTGVRGINYRVHNERGYPVAAFFVTVTDTDGKVHNVYYRISTNGWKAAWKLAVNKVADVTGMSAVLKQRCLKKCPDEATLTK